MSADKYAKVFEVFKNYIHACGKINSLLLDSQSHSKVIDLKHNDFVKNFEESREFKEFIKEVKKEIKNLAWEWGPERLFPEEDYSTMNPYSYLHNFFENTGIYRHIRYEKNFNIEKTFNLFLEETEKQIETTYWGKMLGIGIEFRDKKQIHFEQFSIENWDDKDPNYVIDPYIVKRISVKTPDDEGGFYPNASKFGFIISLYCPNPIFVTWNRESNGLFSSFYNPVKIYDCPDDVIWSNEELEALLSCVWEPGYEIIEDNTDASTSIQRGSNEPSFASLNDPEFIKEIGMDRGRFDNLRAGTAMWEEMEEEERKEWFDFPDKARKFFVTRGQLGNWVPKDDIPKFKGFIDKFIQSGSYEKQKHMKVSLELFEESYRKLANTDRRQSISSRRSLQKPVFIIDHIVILESLYLNEIGELREKLSNSVANLIGKTQLEKAIIREYILKIYKIRSHYLHGLPIKESKEFKKTFNIKGDNIISKKLEVWLRDVVRRSILSFFSLCRHKDKNDRKKLLGILNNPFANKEIAEIQKQASEYLFLCPKSEDMILKLRRGQEPDMPASVKIT